METPSLSAAVRIHLVPEEPERRPHTAPSIAVAPPRPASPSYVSPRARQLQRAAAARIEQRRALQAAGSSPPDPQASPPHARGGRLSEDAAALASLSVPDWQPPWPLGRRPHVYEPPTLSRQARPETAPEQEDRPTLLSLWQRRQTRPSTQPRASRVSASAQAIINRRRSSISGEFGQPKQSHMTLNLMSLFFGGPSDETEQEASKSAASTPAGGAPPSPGAPSRQSSPRAPSKSSTPRPSRGLLLQQNRTSRVGRARLSLAGSPHASVRAAAGQQQGVWEEAEDVKVIRKKPRKPKDPLRRIFGKGNEVGKDTLMQLSRRMRRLVEQSQSEAGMIKERLDWQRQWEALPEAERAFYARAFDRCDSDGDGTLDEAEVLPCLREVGLGGFRADERHAIIEVVDEWLMRSHDIDVAQFTMGLVPMVRSMVEEVRTQDLIRMFSKYCKEDDEGVSVISARRCTEIARDMGLDARYLFSEPGNEEGNITFPEFKQKLIQAEVNTDRIQRDREQQLKERAGIDDHTFAEFREDLMWLYTIFSQYDTDSSGKLDQEEVLRAMKEFGLQPMTPYQKDVILAILSTKDSNKDKQFDLRAFLYIVDSLRERTRNIKREEQKELFRKYDRDRDKMLSVAEITPLLEAMGMTPRNRVEQEEMSALINSVDKSGSDKINFDEFQMFCQKVEERLRRLRFEDEIAKASAMEFTTPQLRDMRWVFDSLDTDMSGKLKGDELNSCLQLLGKTVTKSAFDAIFQDLDKDSSGELDFGEFLEFMRVMRDKEGFFDDNVAKFPQKPRSLEDHVLRRVLENLRLAKSYIMVLSQEELVEVFCGYFEIGPSDNIHDKLGVKSIEELYQLSKRWDTEKRQKLE